MMYDLEDMEKEIRHLKKYEHMYDDLRITNTELVKDREVIEKQMEEYKKQAEKLEHKINKKEKDLQMTEDHMRGYEMKLIEMKEHHEQEVEDIKASES